MQKVGFLVFLSWEYYGFPTLPDSGVLIKYFCGHNQTITAMAKVFKVTPKRIKRSNGLVLTPDMSVIVTTQQHMTSPFSNGAKELKEVYMRIYGFDYQKACCQQADFTFEVLG